MARKRVLLKISGEAFGGGAIGINTNIVHDYAKQIKKVIEDDIQVAIVLGGGNFFRGEELASAGINRSRGDYMGMLGTVINGLALQDALVQSGVSVRVQSAIAMGQITESYVPLKAIRHLNKNRVVIFVAGSGLPYFSTDTVAVQRALEIHCDEISMGKNGTDAVYDDDPRVNPNAKKLEKLQYQTALVNHLQVMDQSAMSLAQQNNIVIKVFGLDKKDSIYNALTDKKIGTIISN